MNGTCMNEDSCVDGRAKELVEREERVEVGGADLGQDTDIDNEGKIVPKNERLRELVEVRCTVYLKEEPNKYKERADKHGYMLLSTLGAKAASTPVYIERSLQVDINEELAKRTGAEKKALIVRALVAELQQEERLNVLVNLGVQKRKAVSAQRAKVLEAIRKLDESLEAQEITKEVHKQMIGILTK